MRAVLTEERFSDDQWIFEPKLDGERVLTYRDGKSLQLFTRNHLSANAQYPDVVRALAEQKPTSYVMDGELVCMKPGTSISSFSQLQKRMHVDNPSSEQIKAAPVFYFVFDLLFLNGTDLRSKSLIERKEILKNSFSFNDHVRFLTHLEKDGILFYKKACQLGWEGLIAKRAASPYRSARSRDWLKFKCVFEQELVIGGYTDPEGSRTQFGALLVGYFEGPRLIFAGKVGTGFNESMLKLVANKMKRLDSNRCPFASVDISRQGLHWVKPELVAQIGFSEWTEDGKLRHPRFIGLRDDKKVKDVTRELPSAQAGSPARARSK
jgi:bifunctional non-homologous end joining protein LigD